MNPLFGGGFHEPQSLIVTVDFVGQAQREYTDGICIAYIDKVIAENMRSLQSMFQRDIMNKQILDM